MSAFDKFRRLDAKASTKMPDIISTNMSDIEMSESCSNSSSSSSIQQPPPAKRPKNVISDNLDSNKLREDRQTNRPTKPLPNISPPAQIEQQQQQVYLRQRSKNDSSKDSEKTLTNSDNLNAKENSRDLSDLRSKFFSGKDTTTNSTSIEKLRNNESVKVS